MTLDANQLAAIRSLVEAHQKISPSYPPDSTLVWDATPEVFTSKGATATFDAKTGQIVVTVTGTASPGTCTVTLYGSSSSVPGFAVAGLPLAIAFDPKAVPASGTYDFPIPPLNNDWSFQISKF